MTQHIASLTAQISAPTPLLSSESLSAPGMSKTIEDDLGIFLASKTGTSVTFSLQANSLHSICGKLKPFSFETSSCSMMF